MDQGVDIGATPVVARESSARSHVFAPAGGVGKIDRPSAAIFLLVRIEVIVDVHAIDVVSLYDIGDDVDRALADGWFAWIHPQHRSIAFDELGMRAADMIGRHRRFC